MSRRSGCEGCSDKSDSAAYRDSLHFVSIIERTAVPGGFPALLKSRNSSTADLMATLTQHVAKWPHADTTAPGGQRTTTSLWRSVRRWPPEAIMRRKLDTKTQALPESFGPFALDSNG